MHHTQTLTPVERPSTSDQWALAQRLSGVAVDDESVALENLGAPFSKTYYVQQAVHKVDGNGYRTRFDNERSICRSSTRPIGTATRR